MAMLTDMNVQRMSISLPPEVAEIVRQAAARAGKSVSAWLADAAVERAEHEAGLADGRAAMAEYEAEYGPLPEELRAKVRAELIELGVIPERPASTR